MIIVFAPLFLKVDIGDADVVVYHSSKCGCVSDWVWHLKAEGYSVAVVKVMDVAAVRKGLRVPKAFSTCHTAKAGKYFIEGHVPMDSVGALIQSQSNIAGIALPGRTDNENSNTIEMGLPEEVVAFDFDGSYRLFHHELASSRK